MAQGSELEKSITADDVLNQWAAIIKSPDNSRWIYFRESPYGGKFEYDPIITHINANTDPGVVCELGLQYLWTELGDTCYVSIGRITSGTRFAKDVAKKIFVVDDDLHPSTFRKAKLIYDFLATKNTKDTKKRLKKGD